MWTEEYIWVIGNKCGGLIKCSTTIALFQCLEAAIKVGGNYGGFTLAKTELMRPNGDKVTQISTEKDISHFCGQIVRIHGCFSP